MISIHRPLAAFLLCFAAFVSVASAQSGAQDWPSRPIKFIVPFPPGGSIDPIARVIAAKMSGNLGQQIVVENKPGASGSIGTALATKAPPDGYTFVFVFDTHATNPYLIPNLPFDTVKDLVPVSLVGTAPMTIVANVNSAYKTFADVVAAAKAKPNSVTYAITNGTLGHLTMIQLQKLAGIEFTAVPYKGATPMVTDLLGGQVDMAVLSPASVTSHVNSGKLRVLSVMGEKRAISLPDGPTSFEQGYKLAAHAWWAIFAPAGTPKPIIQKFYAELRNVLAQPDVRKTLTEQLGMEIVGSTPEELGTWNAKEMARWGQVIRDNNIKVD